MEWTRRDADHDVRAHYARRDDGTLMLREGQRIEIKTSAGTITAHVSRDGTSRYQGMDALADIKNRHGNSESGH